MSKPFFVLNPKSYLYGEKLEKLALKADELSRKYDVKIYFTVPFTELRNIASKTDTIILTAQHMDSTTLGRGMGHIVGEMLLNVGVKAVILNHAEHKMTFEELEKTVNRAKQLNLETIVCASSYDEVLEVSRLYPDTILCEPTNLIGTGITSDEEYIKITTDIIRNFDKKISVMQAAGVTKAEDVYKIIIGGADATGCTSGIVLAENPYKALEDMIVALLKGYKERKENEV